jgi:CBS domain-containing protein
MPTYVRELMLRDIPVLDPRTPLREAAAQMGRSPHGLLVVAEDTHVLGLVTLRHLVFGAEAAAAGHPVYGVGDLVTRRFVLTTADEPLAELGQRFVRGGVRRAVVQDEEGQVTGVISTRELARGARRRWRRLHAVDLSSEGSFPASDPPSWTDTLAG